MVFTTNLLNIFIPDMPSNSTDKLTGIKPMVEVGWFFSFLSWVVISRLFLRTEYPLFIKSLSSLKYWDLFFPILSLEWFGGFLPLDVLLA